jgi:hypothetical protein
MEIAFEALVAALPLLLDGLAAFGALALPVHRRVGGGRGAVVLELGEDLGPAAGLAHGHRVRVRVRPSGTARSGRAAATSAGVWANIVP